MENSVIFGNNVILHHKYQAPQGTIQYLHVLSRSLTQAIDHNLNLLRELKYNQASLDQQEKIEEFWDNNPRIKRAKPEHLKNIQNSLLIKFQHHSLKDVSSRYLLELDQIAYLQLEGDTQKHYYVLLIYRRLPDDISNNLKRIQKILILEQEIETTMQKYQTLSNICDILENGIPLNEFGEEANPFNELLNQLE